jgi:hypothetical protein
MGRTVILIWGGAIFAYLFLVNRQGTSSLLSGLQNFVGGTTKILQGR